MLAVGDRGEMSTDAAIKAPTQKATVVKKPKTFCARTRLECISANRRWKDYRRPCWCCRGTHDLLDELCMGTYLSYRSGVPDTFQSCKALYNRYFHQFSSPYKMFSEIKPKCLHNQRSKSPCCSSPKSLYVQKRSRIYVGYRENTVPTETQMIISAAYAGLNKGSRQLLLHCFHGA